MTNFPLLYIYYKENTILSLSDKDLGVRFNDLIIIYELVVIRSRV